MYSGFSMGNNNSNEGLNKISIVRRKNSAFFRLEVMGLSKTRLIVTLTIGVIVILSVVIFFEYGMHTKAVMEGTLI